MVLVAGNYLGGATDGPPKAPPPISVRATLVGPDGKILPFNGSFSVRWKQDQNTIETPISVAPTIKQGAFTITMPPGKYELEVPDLVEKGYFLKPPATFEIKPGGPNSALVFPVDKLAPLNILVQDAATRKPIQGTWVHTEFDKAVTRGITDENGKARLFVLPGLVKVSGSTAKHEPAYKDVNVGPDGASATLDLEPYLTFVGKVVVPNGKPVTGMWAGVWSKQHSSRARIKGSTFTVSDARKGPCIVVVGAEGLAPIVESLILDGDTERTYTLEEGVEVTFKMDMDSSVLGPDQSGKRQPIPYVYILDHKTGVPIFWFSTAVDEYGKEQVPIEEQKITLSPGRYKIVCVRNGRYFVVAEIDLKGPRTVSVKIKKTTAFDHDEADLSKDMRFPQSP